MCKDILTVIMLKPQLFGRVCNILNVREYVLRIQANSPFEHYIYYKVIAVGGDTCYP